MLEGPEEGRTLIKRFVRYQFMVSKGVMAWG
jgi:hypothetical protein